MFSVNLLILFQGKIGTESACQLGVGAAVQNVSKIIVIVCTTEYWILVMLTLHVYNFSRSCLPADQALYII